MEIFLSTSELAQRTGISPVTWARRRMQGGDSTPPFLKVGRSVRYKWSEVEAWLQKQERHSTSEAA
jgi:predicted DNA-binding transcriptional regulator AlpA